MSKGRGRLPLHVAAWEGNATRVAELLRKGADVNSVDAAGRTALHLATAGGSTMVVATLLGGKADTDIADWEGCTALHIAARHDRVDIFRQLVAIGAKTDLKDAKGRTVADIAFAGSHSTIVETMLRQSTHDDRRRSGEQPEVANQKGLIEKERRMRGNTTQFGGR